MVSFALENPHPNPDIISLADAIRLNYEICQIILLYHPWDETTENDKWVRITQGMDTDEDVINYMDESGGHYQEELDLNQTLVRRLMPGERLVVTYEA